MTDMSDEIRQLRSSEGHKRQASGFQQGFAYGKRLAEGWASGVDNRIEEQVKRIDGHMDLVTDVFDALVRHVAMLDKVDDFDAAKASDEEVEAHAKQFRKVTAQIVKDVQNVKRMRVEVDGMKAALTKVSSLADLDSLRSRFNDEVVTRRVDAMTGRIRDGKEPEAAEAS